MLVSIAPSSCFENNPFSPSVSRQIFPSQAQMSSSAPLTGPFQIPWTGLFPSFTRVFAACSAAEISVTGDGEISAYSSLTESELCVTVRVFA
ncbi:hypothetical protein EVA_13711 [gut metagenome]|uniref:Uncharacterized protein n=1 Tax=gut metagenome TaxID=749906 RepID=J9FTA1_9ZZZZ